MDVPGHARLPGRGRRLGLRVRRRGEAGRRPHARPGAAAQPGPGRVHGRHPDRRRHHQRADVPREPLLPGPEHARTQLVAGRPGDPARHRRTGGGRTARAAGRGTVRRPPGRRRRLRDHRPRLRAWWASSTARGGTARSSCRSSPSPSGWDSPTGRPRRPRRRASRRTRSGRPRASPTWPATSARPWPRRSPRRSTATSSQARRPRAQSQADALSSGLAAASWAMAVFSLAGVADGRGHGSSLVLPGAPSPTRVQPRPLTLHTLPTSATPTRRPAAWRGSRSSAPSPRDPDSFGTFDPLHFCPLRL